MLLTTLDIASDEPTELPICHPKTGEPITSRAPDGTDVPTVFLLLGPESSVARKIRRRHLQRRLDKMNRNKKLNLDADQLEEEAIGDLVAITAGWRGVEWDVEGEFLPFTPQNARMIYERPGLSWIRKQVQEYLDEIGNFVKNSSTGVAGTVDTSSSSPSE